jgi:hypothetical protein
MLGYPTQMINREIKPLTVIKLVLFGWCKANTLRQNPELGSRRSVDCPKPRRHQRNLARKPHRLYFLTTHVYAAGSLRSPVSLYFVSAG